MSIVETEDLYYLVADKRCFLEGLKVFKLLQVETSLGMLEMAIIGSSHYLAIQNSMCEIISCYLPALNTGDPIFQKVASGNFTYNQKFMDFDYQFSLRINQFTNSSFLSEEKKLLIGNYDLFFPFKDRSAITAIRLVKDELGTFSIYTWHTYPETASVIETQSNFIPSFKNHQ